MKDTFLIIGFYVILGMGVIGACYIAIHSPSPQSIKANELSPVLCNQRKCSEGKTPIMFATVDNAKCICVELAK